MRYSKGFSLVELMVVVAIIGVLTAIAVPRFKVFQAKALQAEAKTNLAHIHTMQSAYHIDAGTYAPVCAADGSFRYGMARDGTQECDYKVACNGTTNFLGFQLPNCDRVRYGYFVATSNSTSYPDFVGIAVSSTANPSVRLFPNCMLADVHNVDEDRNFDTITSSPRSVPLNAVARCN